MAHFICTISGWSWRIPLWFSKRKVKVNLYSWLQGQKLWSWEITQHRLLTHTEVFRGKYNVTNAYANLFSAFLSRASHLCPRHSISFATFSLSTESVSSATFPPSFFISSTVGFRSSRSLCRSCQRQEGELFALIVFHIRRMWSH